VVALTSATVAQLAEGSPVRALTEAFRGNAPPQRRRQKTMDLPLSRSQTRSHRSLTPVNSYEHP